jgi:uncharacterized protein YndB with AHSA1/START domain
MPLKTDIPGRRRVEMEFVAPARTEDVWRAVATGPGYAAWFIRAEIEERAGGALCFIFGPDAATSGEVTVWETPRRFGYVERDWSEGAPPVFTEIVLWPRGESQCLVNMSHWIETDSDAWDSDLESFEAGWPGFFDVLAIYLRQWPGQPAAPFQAMSMAQGEPTAIWTKLTSALGVGGANAGERRMLLGPEPRHVLVEKVLQDQKIRFVLLRLDGPAPGVMIIGTYAWGQGVQASVSRFCYGDDAEARAADLEPKWRAWMSEMFPPTN